MMSDVFCVFLTPHPPLIRFCPILAHAPHPGIQKLYLFNLLQTFLYLLTPTVRISVWEPFPIAVDWPYWSYWPLAFGALMILSKYRTVGGVILETQ